MYLLLTLLHIVSNKPLLLLLFLTINVRTIFAKGHLDIGPLLITSSSDERHHLMTTTTTTITTKQTSLTNKEETIEKKERNKLKRNHGTVQKIMIRFPIKVDLIRSNAIHFVL